MTRIRTGTRPSARRSLRALLEAHGYLVEDDGEDGLVVSGDDLAGVAADRDDGEAPNGAVDPGREPLTPRERQVLALVARGLSNRAIAERLSVSPHTAKTHVSSIYGKLGAANRAEAVRRGIRLGLLEV